jgi:hypothetical protein
MASISSTALFVGLNKSHNLTWGLMGVSAKKINISITAHINWIKFTRWIPCIHVYNHAKYQCSINSSSMCNIIVKLWILPNLNNEFRVNRYFSKTVHNNFIKLSICIQHITINNHEKFHKPSISSTILFIEFYT